MLTFAALLAVFVYFFGLPIQSVPFELSSKPIIAYRIAGNEMDARIFLNEPNTIRGYAILQQQAIDDPQLQHEIISTLASRFTYGGQGALCFEPGIAVRFGRGNEAVDALICLGCGHVYFLKNGGYSALSLSDIGRSRIKALYARMFPGHSIDVEEDDAKKVEEQRSAESDRRYRAATSQAATTP